MRGLPKGLAVHDPPNADQLREHDGVTARSMQSRTGSNNTDNDGNNNRCRIPPALTGQRA
eukprot:CAMPEP_0204149126 /NCGR_PEP_ID=MMETSP0361-20130328/24141_1 /ASSEMBLY_ACC=CAM_ASM_000343 /TAXON_ID=268821 /ORGANISM="Scrippsiella Hangoei, Strain SHTV-5" /LENGTH=59 /DNA_ID=CAMNT_0051103583 /DNA_START=797 /DNA_END=972 /DNA_ORIENTATION=+